MVLLGILQPRIYSPENPGWHFSKAAYTWEEIEEEALKIIGKAKQAESIVKSGADHTPYLNATEKGCLWCAAKAICPAYQEASQVAVLEPMFEAVDTGEPLEPQSLGLDTLKKILLYRKEINSFLDAAERYVSAKVREEPDEHPEFKFVRKATKRRWNADVFTIKDVLVDGLGMKQEEVFDLKPKAFSKIEKALKAQGQEHVMDELLIKPEGAVILAPATDKREEVLLGLHID
jgi:hypothetical protein